MSGESSTDSASDSDDIELSGPGALGAGGRVRRGVADEPTPPPVRGVVEVTDDGREFTLYPTDVAETALTTTWMSARDGAYVSLVDYR